MFKGKGHGSQFAVLGGNKRLATARMADRSVERAKNYIEKPT